MKSKTINVFPKTIIQVDKSDYYNITSDNDNSLKRVIVKGKRDDTEINVNLCSIKYDTVEFQEFSSIGSKTFDWIRNCANITFADVTDRYLYVSDENKEEYLNECLKLIGKGYVIEGVVKPVVEYDGLCFTAEQAGSTIQLNTDNITNAQYSTNGSTWNTCSNNQTYTLNNVGDKIYFKAENISNPTMWEVGSHFSMSGKIAASGSVMSLTGDEYSTDMTDNCMSYLFYNCTSLTTAPELPATTLSNGCYSSMFQRCTSLTTAPELPAETMEYMCYMRMFQECTSLTTAPELPATTLNDYCYAYMFSGSSITEAPELPVNDLCVASYAYMFSNCTSLTVAPELPATSLYDYCYSDMFSGCTSLTVAPELPATSLSDSCYSYMFYNCTSLTVAPELPATELDYRCYECMFQNCFSLTSAPDLPATEISYDWLECYNFMFHGCFNLNYIKISATNWIQDSSISDYWMMGVSSSGTFVIDNYELEIDDGDQQNYKIPYPSESGIPEGWTIVRE